MDDLPLPVRPQIPTYKKHHIPTRITFELLESIYWISIGDNTDSLMQCVAVLPYPDINPLTAGTNNRRQNLTTIDDQRTERITKL